MQTTWRLTWWTGLTEDRERVVGNDTLVELLERSGAAVEVYDVGRRVGRLSRPDLLAFERARLPYPLPMQHKAWCGFVQLPDPGDEPVIWFLKLDLDERGLLVQATRDELLARLLESVIADANGANPQLAMNDMPCAFTPPAARMAQFHAQLNADLGRPPSRFFEHARAYFAGELSWSQWEFVGYQGIADVACRHAAVPLARAVPHLPDQPLIALCHCLENQRPQPDLTNALLDRLDEELHADAPGSDRTAALVRALAGAGGLPEVHRGLMALLEHPAGREIDVLAALSGKLWEALLHRPLMDLYLDRLADNSHGQAAFEACLSDLLSLPSLSTTVREALRDPAQADRVRNAFGRMLQRTLQA